jgi:aspartyl protease family protein
MKIHARMLWAMVALPVMATVAARITLAQSSLTPFVGETAEQFETRLRAGTGAQPDQLEPTEFGGVVEVQADGTGHFELRTTVNSSQITMVLDTGASLVVLSHADAAAVGLRVSAADFTRRMETANGVVDAAPVQIKEIRIGGITVRDVSAVVLPPGRLAKSLLGMTFLNRLRGFGIVQGRLTLRG